MIRRRMTVKRVDPWSVLKLGLFLNIAAGVIMLLTGIILWSVIRRLEMIERSCEQVQNIFGIEECTIAGASVFRGGAMMIALWVVVMTAVFVFAAFLYNLIADLTGGIEISAVDHTPGASRSRGGGVEVAPQLRREPQPTMAARPPDATMPADAVDRRTREPSRLKQAVQVAATKITEVTRQASGALTDATQAEAESRARQTEVRTQSMEAVRRQESATQAARRARTSEGPVTSPPVGQRGPGGSTTPVAPGGSAPGTTPEPRRPDARDARQPKQHAAPRQTPQGVPGGPSDARGSNAPSAPTNGRPAGSAPQPPHQGTPSRLSRDATELTFEPRDRANGNGGEGAGDEADRRSRTPSRSRGGGDD